MNNVLILDPCYSSFHQNLGFELSDKVYSLIFDPGYFLYLYKTKTFFVSKVVENYHYTESDVEVVKNIDSLYLEYNRKILEYDDSTLVEYFIYSAKFRRFLIDFIQSYQIGTILIHNDLRWHHSIALNTAKTLGLEVYVTERGIIRPNLTTLDPIGVNGNSSTCNASLPDDLELYKKEAEKIISSGQGVRIFDKFKTYSVFIFFIIVNRVFNFFGYYNPYSIKSYSIRNYFWLLINEMNSNFKSSCEDIVKEEKKLLYYFVPLQVSTDTQLLNHSNYNSVQQFISEVEETFYKYTEDENTFLIFKYHPMELLVEYKFDPRSIVSTDDTNYLIKGSQAVITVNSTVGFEAMRMNKPIFVFGKSFYGTKGGCYDCSNGKFYDCLKKFGDSTGLYSISNIADFFVVKNQISGDLLFNSTGNIIKSALGKILEYREKS